MPRLSTNPDPADRARRDEIRLRELDRTNRRALDAIGDTNLVARHTWGGTGNLSPNLDYLLVKAGHWANYRDDGIATFVDDLDQNAAPGFYLNRPGRWAMTLLVYSDATNAGCMRVALLQDVAGGDVFDGLGEIRDSRYRGAGFSNAGRVDQVLTWTGPVTQAEAANPVVVRCRHDSGGVAAAVSGWRLQLTFLGDAAWPAETPIPPVANVPQDDPAGSSSGEIT